MVEPLRQQSMKTVSLETISDIQLGLLGFIGWECSWRYQQLFGAPCVSLLVGPSGKVRGSHGGTGGLRCQSGHFRLQGEVKNNG